MLRMMENLNRQVLPLLPERDQPSVELQCKSCHRGRPRPVLLTQELAWIIDAHGVDSARAHYRALRDRFGMRGAYDFGEWEMNTLAERLARDGRTADAVAVYSLNAEYYPESAAIMIGLGQPYERTSDTAAAIRQYRRALEVWPTSRVARERLDALRQPD